MEKGTILGSNGNKIESSIKVPALKLRDLGSMPFRLVDLKGVIENRVPPKEAVVGAVQQVNDQTSILLAGMYLLAKDVYSRHPEGSRHFQGFCEDLGLTFNDLQGKKTYPVKELGSI